MENHDDSGGKLMSYILAAEGQIFKIGKYRQLLTINFHSNQDY